MPGRKAEVERKTSETEVRVGLELDGQGVFDGDTGLPFLNHMLELFCRHGLFNLRVAVRGDLEVDAHHTVEDIGITMGRAMRQALGEKHGINRYGSAIVPMDEALMLVALDLSGRCFLDYRVKYLRNRTGGFDVELVEEFLKALVDNAGITLHVKLLSGRNTHHIVESVFKALGRALKEAIRIDPRSEGVPSTKGVLV